LENGMFRLTLHSDCIVDMDYPNDKAYMVYDCYEEIEPGTERDNWNLNGSVRTKTH